MKSTITKVERYRLESNLEGAQNFDRIRQVIAPFTESMYSSYVRDQIEGQPEFSVYRTQNPVASHISIISMDRGKTWDIDAVGNLDELRQESWETEATFNKMPPAKKNAVHALRVNAFDSEAAESWAAALPKPAYIPYTKAFRQLEEKLGEVTAEEIAAWIFMGSNIGGLDAYKSAGEPDHPPRFFFGNHQGERDYLPLVYRCWFKADDIATFKHGERFITGKKLLELWAKLNVIPAADRIRIATEGSHLNPLHPTLGLTQATFPDPDDPFYAPLEDGLFALSEIERIEAEDFGQEGRTVKAEAVARSITKQQVINAFEGLHFNRDKWSKYLADIKSAPWLAACRVTHGKQGSKVSATWNPVLIAAALIDKGITANKLDAAFVRLPDWADEWREVSASFRD